MVSRIRINENVSVMGGCWQTIYCHKLVLMILVFANWIYLVSVINMSPGTLHN